ncbi:MAG: hypothetical protein KGO82_16570 [Bacteroidota bacterium]|nr:hypothetical protein [Bacteroidota bacterium]
MNQLEKRNNQQRGLMLTPAAFSQKLMQCLVSLELPATKSEAKMELISMTTDLMPQGRPSFISIPRYPPISQLIHSEGRKKMLGVLVLLVKDFCSSVNVVRNMNEDQMIEAASMLLEECGNFRLEDYVMMFAMAKKGQFSPEVRILDRVDIQVISSIVDAYWLQRKRAGDEYRDADVRQIEDQISGSSLNHTEMVWNEKKGYEVKRDSTDKIDGLAGALSNLKNQLSENRVGSDDEDMARKQIIKNQNYKNNYNPPTDDK